MSCVWLGCPWNVFRRLSYILLLFLAQTAYNAGRGFHAAQEGEHTPMSTMKLTLLTDFYELTMMQGYFKTGRNPKVVFDVFYRSNPDDGGYAICAGLDQVIDYVKRLSFDEEDITYLRSTRTFDEDFLQYLRNFHFSGDIWAIPEGTVIFPKEPLVKVIAPIMEA